MIERTNYIEKLLGWKDEQVIKVVTGIRRCGKSTLLRQYQDALRQRGVSEEQIISVNFEELENEPLLDYHALYDHIKARLCGGRMTYIFLDEIQKVPFYEKAVDSLYVKENTDIYLTGSNAYMLSGTLQRCLPGAMLSFPCCRCPLANTAARRTARAKRRSMNTCATAECRI